VADELPNLTVEILKQIRDGISHLETNLGARLDALRTELKGEITGLRTELKGEMTTLRTELKGEMSELRSVMAQHGRIVDNALHVSLEDSGRLEALEGRVRTLEEEVRAMREPR
jgi:chromosome segregation ATPase